MSMMELTLRTRVESTFRRQETSHHHAAPAERVRFGGCRVMTPNRRPSMPQAIARRRSSKRQRIVP
jgi:hypothetical protein